ncbi:xanthine dehydrogenase family protein molybdopterin-binding subunit [Sphingomonas koreensis]|nr:xanthine dehydrogenase family protein molybdopterin-binding subunit [Sphingomonas koreensis]
MATGWPHERADARLKVTGAARFTADFTVPGMAYVVLATSTIAKGRVASIDVAAAEAANGVLKVLTHLNAMRVNKPKDVFDPTVPQPPKPNEVSTNTASSVLPLQSDEIHFWGQIVAAVVGESLEAAQAGADLVVVRYEEETPACSMLASLPDAQKPKSFAGKPLVIIEGDPEGALLRATTKIDESYSTPIENHHAMEMQSTVVEWRGGELFVEETSRFVQGAKRNLAQSFGLPDDHVHVRAKFVGGAFGSKGAVRPHVALAAMCAAQTGRPVKLLLTRRQVTFVSGHRPDTLQRFALGAESDGRLAALVHEGFNSCSATDPFIEAFTTLSTDLYAAPNRALGQKIVFLNVNQPTNMRGPGETSGMYAQESAMDELAHALSIDPLELRRLNEPDAEPITGKEFSCRRLLNCIEQGAEAFGWSQRRPAPGTRREGDWLIGHGYASTTYPLKGSPCQARVRIRADGGIVVESSTHDFGNGISTAARQIAAETLGVGYDDIYFDYADSDLPPAMQTGGSTTTMWVGTAIKQACEDVLAQLRDLGATGGEGVLDLASILRSAGRDEVTAVAEAEPDKAKLKKYSMNSYGAHFCEIAVDADTGVAQVRRFLSVLNCGRIINPTLARSQYIGAVTMGIGMALMEGNELDPRNGMWINAELADYHVPVYADTHSMRVTFLEDPDMFANPLGAKGLGEMGLVGTAAAIANAVFNATGKRIRDLPITPDKLL